MKISKEQYNKLPKELQSYFVSIQGGNTHCCGKSISLYSYLINLFTHPHDLVLDPYCGSGTTPIACVLTNRHYIGLELEKEYFDIAEARVEYWKTQKNGVKSASASISNVSASTGVKDIQGNLF